jgi:hypothetical protein
MGGLFQARRTTHFSSPAPRLEAKRKREWQPSQLPNAQIDTYLQLRLETDERPFEPIFSSVIILAETRSLFCFWNHLHGHLTQFLIKPAFAAQRPPIIKIYFHRPPHRDPASDRQTLSHDTGPGSFIIAEEELASSKASRKEQQSYEQAGTAASHQPPKGETIKISAVGKVVVDTISHQLCGIFRRPFLQINPQR